MRFASRKQRKTLRVKLTHIPGAFRVVNKNAKEWNDTTNTSYIWGYYHQTMNQRDTETYELDK